MNIDSFDSHLKYTEFCYNLTRTNKKLVLIGCDATSIGPNVRVTKSGEVYGLIKKLKESRETKISDYEEFLAFLEKNY